MATIQEKITDFESRHFLYNLNKDIESKANNYLHRLDMQIHNFKFIQDRKKLLYLQTCGRSIRSENKNTFKLIDMESKNVNGFFEDEIIVTGPTGIPMRRKISYDEIISEYKCNGSHIIDVTATPIRTKHKNKMTLLKIANVFFFQWFFVRLTRCQDFHGMIGLGDGSFSKVQWYSIQYFILPCTGWWNKFIYLNGKPKFLRITKYKFL